MTDKEIITALKCCSVYHRCSKCEYNENSAICISNLMNDALDLINRQQAEIERLHNILLSFTNEVGTWSSRKGYDTSELSLIPILDKAKNIKAEVRAEAIKEFAERLMNKADVVSVDAFNYKYIISSDEIYDLVKEMDKGGEEN